MKKMSTRILCFCAFFLKKNLLLAISIIYTDFSTTLRSAQNDNLQYIAYNSAYSIFKIVDIML